MSSPGSSTARREGDEWTMVDRCVSELMENEVIGDMTLPPVPQSDGGGGEDGHTSSSGSGGGSSSDNEGEDEGHDDGDGYNYDDYDDQGWSGDEEEPLANGEEKVPATVRPRPAIASPATFARLRRQAAATANFRRPGGRRRERVACLPVGVSSPSVSPTRPHRRSRGGGGGGGGGRTERTGRRVDEGPPPLQSASEASDNTSSSSSSSEGQEEGRREREPSLTGGRGGPVALPVGGGAESGGSGIDDGGGDGNGPVMFSLSELVCVASETVLSVTGDSAASSPFRIQSSGGGGGGGGGGDGVLPPRFPAAGDDTLSSGSSSTVPATGAEAQADPAAAARTSVPAVLEEGADGRLRATPRLSELAAARYRSSGGLCDESRAAGVDAVSSGSVRRVGSALVLPPGRSSCSSSSSSSSSSTDGRSKGYDDGDHGTDDGEKEDDAEDLAGAESTPAGISSRGSGSTSLSAATGEETTTSPSSSFLSARGLTPSSLVPLGSLRNWEGGSKGGGGGGASMNMSASLAGLAGYKSSALLEARRAAAAEEQGEFWQRRAGAAEKANGHLQKVVAEQKTQIAALLERFASLEAEKAAALSAASSAPGDGKTPSPVVVGDEDNAAAGGDASLSCTAAAARSAGCGQQRRGAGRGRIGTAEEMGEGRAAIAGGAAAGEEEEEERGGVGGALACIGGIAFTRFSVGQVAMFFPTPEGNFLAFNVGCPRHFLSKESQDLVGRDEHFRSYYVLGRIIEIRDLTCEGENPYSLPVGQSIKVVSVESITPDLHRAGVVPCK